MQTHIDLKFADGTYRCALGLTEINELQNKCKIGIGGLYARVLQGRIAEDISIGHPLYAAYYMDDLIETVRHGLIGGGLGIVNGQEIKVGSLRANELVENYLLPLPLMEQWQLAAAILHAKIDGYTPPEGKKKARRPRKAKPTPDGSTTPPP